MTPLFRFFERFVPSWLAYAGVCLAYAFMMLALLLFGQPTGEAILYIDIGS